MIAIGAIAPSVASAATSCVAVFEKCLNDTYDTSGLTRYLANLECASRYAGCLRQAIF